VEDSIQQAFGMNAAQFDKVFRDYVLGGRYRYYVLPTPSTIVSDAFKVSPLSSPDSRAVLADIHLHSQDYRDKAITEFQEVLKEDPNNAPACRGLGYAYLQRQDFKQATEYFHRASQANSKDSRVHYYSALLMSREGHFSDHSVLLEAIKELETSISLDPTFADSYMILGIARMNNRDLPGAMQATLKAVSLSPRNENYQFNLAQMYMDDQKFDQAITLLQTLQKNQDPQLAVPVNQALLQAQEMMREARERANSSVPTGLFIKEVASEHSISPQIEGETSVGSANLVTEPTRKAAKFLKGVITGVDCSSPPAAVVTVAAGPKIWKMNVRDSDHVVVLGADKFSCSWVKQKVAFNYRDAGDAGGDVISIEIQ
jgi:Flp pilus assembly protein TadD